MQHPLFCLSYGVLEIIDNYCGLFGIGLKTTGVVFRLVLLDLSMVIDFLCCIWEEQ